MESIRPEARLKLLKLENFSADTLKDEASFALGCPAMGAEVLEESEMEPFVSEVEAFASGKKSVYLVLTAGVMVSGCLTGLSA